MDQQVFHLFDNFDPGAVDVEKPATTPAEYLRQVYVQRMDCPEYIKAELNVVRAQTSSSTVDVFSDQYVPQTCELAPGKQWQEGFAKKFLRHREKLENLRNDIPKLNLKGLPPISNGVLWKKLCLVERNVAIPIAPEQFQMFDKHRGTPPTTRFVCSLSHVTIDKLIGFLISAFSEIGYSRALFEWIYSLLLVVQTPIDQSLLGTLRIFVKQCREARALLTAEDNDKIIEFTMFIVIISLSFYQKDLADFK